MQTIFRAKLAKPSGEKLQHNYILAGVISIMRRLTQAVVSCQILLAMIKGSYLDSEVHWIDGLFHHFSIYGQVHQQSSSTAWSLSCLELETSAAIGKHKYPHSMCTIHSHVK